MRSWGPYPPPSRLPAACAPAHSMVATPAMSPAPSPFTPPVEGLPRLLCPITLAAVFRVRTYSTVDCKAPAMSTITDKLTLSSCTTTQMHDKQHFSWSQRQLRRRRRRRRMTNNKGQQQQRLGISDHRSQNKAAGPPPCANRPLAHLVPVGDAQPHTGAGPIDRAKSAQASMPDGVGGVQSSPGPSRVRVPNERKGFLCLGCPRENPGCPVLKDATERQQALLYGQWFSQGRGEDRRVR